MGTPLSFGSELRRLRHRAGLSLGAFAQLANYDKGYLSKVERGVRRPSFDLAQRCDALLDAGGRLRRLVEPQGPSDDSDNDPHRFVQRRDLLVSGTGSLLGVILTRNDGDPAPANLPIGASFRTQFDQIRQLGQGADPKVLLPLLESQTRMLVQSAARSGARERARFLVLAARFAEYAGWMAQESGDDRNAIDLTAQAVEMAQAGGDTDLSSYALVRRALIAFYKSDAEQTIGLADQAQDSALPPRIRGLAAQREAQGHALAGDERACLKSLDRARDLLGSADARTSEAPVIGSTNLADSVSMVNGWCLHDLGRPRAAVEILDRECLRIAPRAHRTRMRYGMRRALAHAAAGEVEHSCEIAKELLDVASIVPSATVRTDIRRLARELQRFQANRTVRDLQPALALAVDQTR
ncbi:helix-turn-helix domain-containing protein [Embleya sp. NPDC056575]|uniref:helix-turn-helix domain-containing protein n=1 Tax=unclassified Embleya TaxID=2699296 RepID=UPI0036A7434A